MSVIIQTENLEKTYNTGKISFKALRGINLKIEKGEFTAVMGASGSGKSTLMNIIGCLDNPTEGKYLLDGIDTSKLTKNQYADIRNQKIGFVFQGFNLIPRTTAFENVELPLFYDRTERIKHPKKAAEEALEMVGLKDRMYHIPTEMSGGQQQRVAIARALVNNPSIVLADEPTGNLDSVTSVDIMSVFQELNQKGITIILVTHEPDIALYAKRKIVLKDGLIVNDISIEKRREAKNDLEHLEKREL